MDVHKAAPVLEKYYTDIFSYYIDMGFKKLKLDMSYGKKEDMKTLLKMIFLPDLYGGATADRFVAAVREWKERHRA